MKRIFDYDISEERDNRKYANFQFLNPIIVPEQGNEKIFSVPLPIIIPSDVSEELDYVNIAFIEKSKMLKVVNKCPMLPKFFFDQVSLYHCDTISLY